MFEADLLKTRVAGPIVDETHRQQVNEIANIFSYITRVRQGVQTPEPAAWPPGRPGRATLPAQRLASVKRLVQHRREHPWSHVGHIAQSRVEAREALVQLVDTGVRENHLVAVIHPFARQSHAVRNLEGRRLDVERLRGEAFLLVTGAASALQGEGHHIDAAHFDWMAARLEDYAPSLGRLGVQIICDASHAYLSNGRDDEWFAFEEWLRRGFRRRVGMTCLYRSSDITADRLSRLPKSHQVDHRSPVPALSPLALPTPRAPVGVGAP